MVTIDRDVDSLIAQISAAPGMARLRQLSSSADVDVDVLGAMLAHALRLSRESLAPFDRAADMSGCRLESGRVVLAPGHHAAWNEFREGGWAGIDIASEFGGAGLPRILATAVQECFDRGSVSFGMVPGAARAAARLLQAYASTAIAEAWIPKLASGLWGATICISESGAGSDVGRIQTAARCDSSGRWFIRGEKMWISYADHDLTERIGHVVLARPDGASAGVRGLSVFLVSSVLDSHGAPPPA